MEKWEISGNLNNQDGIMNYIVFQDTIMKVITEYYKVFSNEIIHRYPLLIDNATKGSGHTPIITSILDKYLIIKLGIEDGLNIAETVFQFAHEMMHLVFYSLIGLNKERAGNEEESLCTAASLCLIKSLTPESLNIFKGHVAGLEHEGYRNGLKIAEECDYSLEKIREIIFSKL